MTARRTAQEAIHANQDQFEQAELVRLLEQEMLEAAQNLEFERAAQLRDKINEIKGAPIIKGSRSPADENNGQKSGIWRPKNAGRAKRRMAK
jgi:excinuclease ABC subunit B